MNLPYVILLSSLMGLSIFLSFPLIFSKGIKNKNMSLINSFAIGLLIFIMTDVFSDSSDIIYNGSLYGYGTEPFYDIVFCFAFLLGFSIFYFIGNIGRNGKTSITVPAIIALGIGFQNLTEGLVFGAFGATIGFSGLIDVILIGFTLQNISEGFPIYSSYLNYGNNKVAPLLILFLVGGVPTIIGGVTGFYYFSKDFILFFDGLAIGSILYVILPMFKNILNLEHKGKFNSVYFSIMIGFITGFIVNLI